ADPRRQGQGGQGISNVGCMTLRLDRYPDDDQLFYAKVLHSNISALPPAMIFRLPETGDGCVRWEFVRWEDLDNRFLLDGGDLGMEKDERTRLIELIVAAVIPGGIPRTLVITMARDHGWSYRQVKHCALTVLKVRSQRQGFGKGAQQMWFPPKKGWPK